MFSYRNNVGILGTENSPQTDSLSQKRAAKFTPLLETDENISKKAFPRDLVVLNCTVRNMGNMVDDYVVETNTPAGWQIILYPDKFDRIPPFNSPSPESERVKSLTVKIIVGDIYNATVGNYSIDITLKSKLAPANISMIPFVVEVGLDHMLDISTPEKQQVDPGQQLIYDFQVTNLGNGDDIYDVWPESSDYEWLVQLVDDTQEILNIEMGDTIIISVILFVPMEADAGQTQITSLWAKPIVKREEPKWNSWVETSVRKIYDIEIKGTPEPEEGQPLDYTTFVFTIENVGNSLDDIIGSEGTFVVAKYPSDPAGWEWWFDTTNIREGGLPKGLDADIELRIKVPPSTPVGKYTFIVNVLSDDPLVYEDSVALTVDVVSVFKAEIFYNITEKKGHIGDNISFESRITNIGNIMDTYIFAIESMYPDWIYIGEKRFKVDFGLNGTFGFNIKIPYGASAKDYEFTLVLASEGDENITFQHLFIVEVLETLDFQFLTTNVTYDAIPGGATVIDLEIQNTGNSDVTLSFLIHGEDWGLLAQKNLYLSYKETKSFSLTFSPPKNVELKAYTFEILGRITLGADTVKTTKVIIRVVEFEFGCTDIYINEITKTDGYKVKEKERINFKFGVVNQGNQYFDSNKFGNVLDIAVYVEGRNNPVFKTNITYLERNVYEIKNFEYTFNEKGLFNLTVELTGIDDNNTRNNIGTAKIRVLEIDDDNGDDDDDHDDHDSVTPEDWLYASLIVMAGFIIILLALAIIRSKYSVRELKYDATDDYDLKEGTTLIDDLDFDDLLDEDMPEQEAGAALQQYPQQQPMGQSYMQYGQQDQYGYPGAMAPAGQQQMQYDQYGQYEQYDQSQEYYDQSQEYYGQDYEQDAQYQGETAYGVQDTPTVSLPLSTDQQPGTEMKLLPEQTETSQQEGMDAPKTIPVTTTEPPNTIPVTTIPAKTVPVTRPATTAPVTQPVAATQPPKTVPVTTPAKTVPVTRPATTAPVTQPPKTVPVTTPARTLPVTQPTTTIPTTQPPKTAPVQPSTSAVNTPPAPGPKQSTSKKIENLLAQLES